MFGYCTLTVYYRDMKILFRISSSNLIRIVCDEFTNQIISSQGNTFNHVK